MWNTGLRQEVYLSRSQPPKISTEQWKQGLQGKVLQTVVYNHVFVLARETYFFRVLVHFFLSLKNV